MHRKVIDYRILNARYLGEIEHQIKAYLIDGWDISGNLMVISSVNYQGDLAAEYTQAMVKFVKAECDHEFVSADRNGDVDVCKKCGICPAYVTDTKPTSIPCEHCNKKYLFRNPTNIKESIYQCKTCGVVISLPIDGSVNIY